MEPMLDLSHTIVVDSEMELFINSIRYQGFDPKRVRQLLALKESNEAQLKSDVVELLIVALERGTNIKKMTMRMLDEGKDRVLQLMSKYSVKVGVPEHADDVTLARILSSFPILASKILKTGRVRVVGDNEDLPMSLAHVAGASLIPHSDERLFLKWKKWRTNFSKVINSNDSKVDYDKIIWDSNLYNEKDRKEIWNLLQ
jgi:hypothetical protein